jgi:hypothetical protein
MLRGNPAKVATAVATKKVSIAAPPFVNWPGAWGLSSAFPASKKPTRGEWVQVNDLGGGIGWLGTKTSWFDQTHLVPSSSKFPALVTLDDNTATGFDPDHTGTNPAKGCGFQHLDHISGLKIQLHVREGKTTGQTRTEADQSIARTRFWGSTLDEVSGHWGHRTRRGGLEPPTSGFGDLRSTN